MKKLPLWSRSVTGKNFLKTRTNGFFSGLLWKLYRLTNKVAYREKAIEHFNSVLEEKINLFIKYDIEKPLVEIRSMSKRWGSCTVKGKVILNPELIKAPKGSIEYE